MKKTTVYGSILNCGDGSASVRWFTTRKKAEKDQEEQNNDEGWAEECIETAETYEGSNIHKEAVENNNRKAI